MDNVKKKAINDSLNANINIISHYLIPVEEIQVILAKYGINVNLYNHLNLRVNNIHKDQDALVVMSNCTLMLQWDYSQDTGIYKVTAKIQ